MRTKDCRPRDYGNLMGKFTLCGPVQFRFNITSSIFTVDWRDFAN